MTEKTFDYTPPGSVFWRSHNGEVEIVRHCDGVFELFCRSESVMPPCRFERIANYVWAEFPPW